MNHSVLAIFFGIMILGMFLIFLAKILGSSGAGNFMVLGMFGMLCVFGSWIGIGCYWAYTQISTTDMHIVVGFIGLCILTCVFLVISCLGISIIFAGIGKILK